MCAAKKQVTSSHVPVWPRKLIAWIFGKGRRWVILAVMVGLFVGGWYVTWHWFKPSILHSPEYRVGPEQVEITPLPPWIHSKIVEEVFRDPTLDPPLGIMDEGLAERIAKAFSRHPWVSKASVRIKHPARVCVELVYRQPACIVEVSGERLPVSAEGILLPRGDFTTSEAARYPLLTGVDRFPTVSAGSRWGNDAKVIGGAEIADVLGPVWERMGLQRIEPLASDPAGVGGIDAGRPSQEPFFVLFTRGGTRILWGYAPGSKVINELPAEEKVGRLQRYLSVNDTLDGRPGQKKELDVRRLLPAVR